jgi:hypothetical protein
MRRVRCGAQEESTLPARVTGAQEETHSIRLMALIPTKHEPLFRAMLPALLQTSIPIML